VSVASAGEEKLDLQKLFSAFPGGWPGVGLLLLRLLIGIAVAVQTVAYVQSTELHVADLLVVALVLIGAGCLLVGFVTPVAAALIGVIAVSLGFSTLRHSLDYFEVIVLAIAIGLLGPGAFSIDARMFGRREILIPNTRSSKS